MSAVPPAPPAFPGDFAALLRAALPAGGPFPSPPALAAMELHARLLIQWNERFQLTAIRGPDEIVRRHFAEPLLALEPLGERGSLLDLGTGGGFPGLPLHIAAVLGTVGTGRQALGAGTSARGRRLILVERSRNKVTFLETVVGRLDLEGVLVVERDVRKPGDLADLMPVDAVTLRAVGDPGRKVAWLPDLLSPGGVALLFLGESGCVAAEAAARKQGLRVEPRRRVPGTGASFLLVIHAREA